MNKIFLILVAILTVIYVQAQSDCTNKYHSEAEEGNAEAQFKLGECYRNSLNSLNTLEQLTLVQKMAVASQNVEYYKQAVYWYRKAAEQGHADAQFNLGIFYREGIIVNQSHEQAAYWYRKAAEQGHADAQFRLGFVYERGIGVTQSYEQAIYWYRKAAEQGDALAQFNLGIYYYEGEKVTQDIEQAKYWFRKAAEQEGYIHEDIFRKIFALSLDTLHAENEKQTVNQYALNAIEQAVVKYLQHEFVGYGEYRMVTLTLIRIDQESGEFFLKAIDNHWEYKHFDPTHYIRVDNKTILVKADSSCNCRPEQYGIRRMTENVRMEVAMRLSGKRFATYYNPKTNKTDTVFAMNFVNNEFTSSMIFSYKKHKINSRLYRHNEPRPLFGREYWSDWKLSLSVAQKSAKPYYVKNNNNAYDLKKIEEKMRDSLQKRLRENTELPIEVRNQDLNKLIFKPVFMHRLDFGSEVFCDTSSIYPYIKPDMEHQQPYEVLIFKKNRFWGLLFLDGDNMKFKTAAEINDYDIGLYENLLRQKPNTLFYISTFGYGRLWYTKSDKIFLLFNGRKYHEEADEYIHRYKTPETIMKWYGRE